MEDSSFKSKVKANLFPIIVIGLGIVLIAGGLIYSKYKNKSSQAIAPRAQSWNEDGTVKPGTDCAVKTETIKAPAAGSDIFKPGQEIEVEMNYYACNKGARDEIVMIQTPGRNDPIFKYIKMIPGDKYTVAAGKNKKFHVTVNGKSMKNPQGEPYSFTDRKSRMIKLYESNFKDGIKGGVYFVFGKTSAGGFDSTRFGPVTSERMVGRVITKP
jgi:hypothetical protein